MFNLARETAARLALQFSTDFPVSLQEMTGRKTQDIYARALGALKHRAAEIQLEHKFGIVSRIVLARTFQTELRSGKYHGAILKQATSELASALTFAH
jgi:hypothetical protein